MGIKIIAILCLQHRTNQRRKNRNCPSSTQNADSSHKIIIRWREYSIKNNPKSEGNHVFNFFPGASVVTPPSGLLRFLSISSSLAKPGPVGTEGVGKVSGLGNMLVSGPDRPNPHSGKKLDGDGRSASDTNRLGRAEIGVSILLLLP